MKNASGTASSLPRRTHINKELAHPLLPSQPAKAVPQYLPLGRPLAAQYINGKQEGGREEFRKRFVPRIGNF